jgi:hypothetical protein
MDQALVETCAFIIRRISHITKFPQTHYRSRCCNPDTAVANSYFLAGNSVFTSRLACGSIRISLYPRPLRIHTWFEIQTEMQLLSFKDDIFIFMYFYKVGWIHFEIFCGRFEVPTSVTMKNIFCGVTPYSLVDVYRRTASILSVKE